MILFWVICAAFLLLALAFILPPALERVDEPENTDRDERRQANIAVYRDQLSELEADLKNGIIGQEQFAQAREEIERRLLEDTASSSGSGRVAAVKATAKSSVYIVGIAIPLAAIVFYMNVGTPKSITGEAMPASPPVQQQQASAPRSQEQIEANVAALAQRLKENPADAACWTMLARSYSSMERFGESAGAYAKATELNPRDADLWAEYAFASAMANGRSLEGRPQELIEQALQVEPENAKALQLAGSAAFQMKDYKKAIGYWERVLKQVPADSEVGGLIKSRLDEAKTLAGSK
jgi:cytochrome c-type biogenesis protein CcmH